MAVEVLYHSVLTPLNENSRKIRLRIFQHNNKGRLSIPFVSYRFLTQDNKGSDEFICVNIDDMYELLRFMCRLDPVAFGKEKRIELKQTVEGWLIEVTKKGKITQKMALTADEMQAFIFSEEHVKSYLPLDVCD